MIKITEKCISYIYLYLAGVARRAPISNVRVRIFVRPASTNGNVFLIHTIVVKKSEVLINKRKSIKHHITGDCEELLYFSHFLDGNLQ